MKKVALLVFALLLMSSKSVLAVPPAQKPAPLNTAKPNVNEVGRWQIVNTEAPGMRTILLDTLTGVSFTAGRCSDSGLANCWLYIDHGK